RPVLLRGDDNRAVADDRVLAAEPGHLVGIHRNGAACRGRRLFWLMGPALLQLFPERDWLSDRLDAVVELGAREARPAAPVPSPRHFSLHAPSGVSQFAGIG